MSRAFVKEADGEDVFFDFPDRPVSGHKNFVTSRGLALIEATTTQLRAALRDAQARNDRGAIAELSRDLRYWAARLGNAELVPPTTNTDTLRFGQRVTIQRDDGRRQSFRLVGQDESDPARGLLSYVAPLALALTGKSVGDQVKSGAGEVAIVAIETVSDGAGETGRI